MVGLKVLIGPDGSGKSYSCKGLRRYVVTDETSLRTVVSDSTEDNFVVDVWYDINPKTLLRYQDMDIIFELHISADRLSDYKDLSPMIFYPPTMEEKRKILSYLPDKTIEEIAPLLSNWYEIVKFVEDGIIPLQQQETHTDEYWISRLGWRYALWANRWIMSLLLRNIHQFCCVIR